MQNDAEQGIKPELLGIFTASIGALLWGFSGSCAQYLYDNYEINSAFITMVRALSASVLFLIAIVWKKRSVAEKLLGDKRSVRRLILFGLSLYGSQFMYVASVGATNAGTATVLQMSYMVFVLVYETFVAKKLPSWRDLAGFACALVGTWVIATQGNPATLSLPLNGLVLGLLNGLFVAIYVICPQKLFDQFGSFVTTGLGIMVNTVFACTVWCVGATATGLLVVPELDAVGYLVLTGGVGAVGTFAAFALYLHGVSIVGSVKGGLLGAFEPIGAMFISLIWLGTAFSHSDWIGLVLMLAMLAFITVPTKSEKSDSESEAP